MTFAAYWLFIGVAALGNAYEEPVRSEGHAALGVRDPGPEAVGTQGDDGHVNPVDPGLALPRVEVVEGHAEEGDAAEEDDGIEKAPDWNFHLGPEELHAQLRGLD